MKELRSEIEIDSNPSRVWNVLVDFEKYDQWNPFIRRIVGSAKEGSKIRIFLETPGGKNRKYEPTITSVKQGHELRWRGKGFFLDAEHIFTIEKLEPERVRFVQHEIFKGLLTSFFGSSTDSDIKAALKQMNRALKERVEKTAI